MVRGFLGSISTRRTRARARKKAAELHGTDVPAARMIGEAITEAVDEELAPDEKELIAGVESIRNRYRDSSEEITVTDYGAGPSDQQRSEEEMYEGVETTVTLSKVCNASKPPLWSLLLFKLVSKFRPRRVIELGTCLGVSAGYQASALKLNGRGRLITLEGAEAVAQLAAGNLKGLGLDNVKVVSGRFQDNLEGVLDEHGPVDHAFIDGHHEEKATVAYYRQFLPHLAERSVLIFDDINWSPGMRRAWDSIREDDRVGLSVDLQEIGVCVLSPDIEGKLSFAVPLK